MLNYHRWLDRLQALERRYGNSRASLTALCVIVFLLGGLSYRLWLDFAPEETQYSTSGKRKLTLELERQTQETARKNLALAIEQEANAEMQKMFTRQLAQQKVLEKELAFYRSVMAPETNAEGLAIHALELTPGLVVNRYQVRLILTQLQKRKYNLRGRAQLLFIGLVDGKHTELSLDKLTKTKFDFAFQYFQILDAEINLPANFSLARVELKAKVRAGRGNKAATLSQVFDVSELLASEKELGVILEQNSQVKDNSLNSVTKR
ncbi:conserved hypothetical protein [Shewanella denitrificans OS217]|uniref:Uncharacterized protein n=1 Tax=Shewanella denitrificans (strain OS217 / ATCC BAA-1090 / DSM 15013) TaxID=318161 RepID=Q12KD1_SHEDO|nr:DUF6776 family protein [Shewanella denitrificans]ABE56095.1 conserved hypothetical protein [Shewanella denitrificans OS217]